MDRLNAEENCIVRKSAVALIHVRLQMWSIFFTFGGLTAALFQVNTVLTIVYVVVQFYPWFKPYFPLFQAPFHTQKQRKIKFKSRIKLNHNIYINTSMTCMVYMLN